MAIEREFNDNGVRACPSRKLNRISWANLRGKEFGGAETKRNRQEMTTAIEETLSRRIFALRADPEHGCLTGESNPFAMPRRAYSDDEARRPVNMRRPLRFFGVRSVAYQERPFLVRGGFDPRGSSQRTTGSHAEAGAH